MVVACGNNSDKETTPTSFLSRTQTYALLKQQMEVAAKSEVSSSVLFLSLSILESEIGR